MFCGLIRFCEEINKDKRIKKSGKRGKAGMLFWKKKKTQQTEQKKDIYEVESEDLAIPEVHTVAGKHPEEVEHRDEAISYDDVAIPEVHIRKTTK